MDNNNNNGTLYIIATPIGNSQDITLRALNKLNTLDLITCEDTRITSKLCNIHKISVKGRLMSYHDHNAKKMIPIIIKLLKEGKNIGYTSDAGTPLISDPGFKLVLEAINNEINVKSVPGPSALTAALSISGISSDQFFFSGFLPKKKKARKEKIILFKELKVSIVIFEASSRIKALLEEIYSILGNRKISILKEITKIYEKTEYGNINDLLNKIKNENLKGEYVVIIEKKDKEIPNLTKKEIQELLKDKISKMSISKASKEIAKKTMTKSDYIYKIALSMKKNINN
tara:strand:+ start:14618 stop:15478 length:861 start_codon:yes stop_codon:yes gene_type:complete